MAHIKMRMKARYLKKKILKNSFIRIRECMYSANNYVVKL